MTECLDHKTGGTIRWYRKDTSYFFAEYLIKLNLTDKTNLHEVANHVRKTIRNEVEYYRYIVVPLIASELLKEIKEKDISLKPIIYQKRYDSSSLKERDIGLTSIKQQIYDYIIVNACKDMFLAKIGVHQCSSIPGRGQIYAKRFLERWIRRQYKSSRYVTKLDIKKYYPSVNHDVLFKFLERDIKNEEVLYVLKTLVCSYSDNGYGLCIGTYLSQFLANYFLSYAYHYISEGVYRIRKSRRSNTNKRVRLISHVLFYMDDIVIFSSNKKDLKKATLLLIKYLKEELRLEIKNNSYLFVDMYKKNAFIDVVGFKFYLDRTTIRKRIYKKIRLNLKTIKKYKDKTNIDILRAFMSRHGYVKHSVSRKLKRITMYEDCFNIARRRISYEERSNVYRKAA